MGNGLRKATAAVYGVKIGQCWADNDPRLKTPRTLEVMGFESAKGVVRVRCHVHQTGREVLIKVSRFRPTHNGYRLIETPAITVATIRKMKEQLSAKNMLPTHGTVVLQPYTDFRGLTEMLKDDLSRTRKRELYR